MSASMADEQAMELVERTHSPLGPSAIFRRELCPGSYRQEKDLPDRKSNDATRGSTLHRATEVILSGRVKAEEITEALAPEDQAAVDSCLAFAGQHCEEHPEAELMLEHRIDLSALHPEIGFGTADFILVEPFQWALIIDWKFGHVDPPPAKENRQLALLAWAVASEFECPQVAVALVLGFQDRYSSHIYAGDDFHTIRDHFCTVAERAMSPWAPLIPQPDACRYCRAILQCPAILSLACELPLEKRPDDVVPSEMGKLLDYAEQIKPWVNAVQRRAFQIAYAGGTVPGYVRAFGRKSRGWSAEATEAKLREVAEKVGKPAEAIITKELASPAAIEKAWGKAKAVREALAGLIESKPGKVTLVKAKEESHEGDQ